MWRQAASPPHVLSPLATLNALVCRGRWAAPAVCCWFGCVCRRRRQAGAKLDKCIVQRVLGSCPSQSAPCREGLDTNLIRGSSDPDESTFKPHLDRFSRFCTARQFVTKLVVIATSLEQSENRCQIVYLHTLLPFKRWLYPWLYIRKVPI